MDKKEKLTLEIKVFDFEEVEGKGANVKSQVSIDGYASPKLLTIATANLAQAVFNNILKKLQEESPDNHLVKKEAIKKIFFDELKCYFEQFDGKKEDSKDSIFSEIFDLLSDIFNK